MGKNIVVCLDGTNNQIRAAGNTNVVRMCALLDLTDETRQVGYYDPGVGTASSPAAWTPVARTVSRYAGLAFGAGLRQNLGEAYTFLMQTYEPGDRLFLFGFSRGAYTARALTGMLEVFGLLRPGAENLVPYAVAEYAKQEPRRRRRDWRVAREYAQVFARSVDGRKDHAPVHFLGIWDTVKAAGTMWRQLRWPYTRQLPHVATIRHAVSIDEKRRPYAAYLVERTSPSHAFTSSQDVEEVWFAGAHSDVGGTFPTGVQLSDIPFKWMAQHAVAAGLVVRPAAYRRAQQAVTDHQATGPIRPIGQRWAALGVRPRVVPEGAAVHASVRRRVAADPAYAARLPAAFRYVDDDWRDSVTGP